MAQRKYDFYDKTHPAYPDLSLAKTKEIGDKIGVDWTKYDIGELRQGIKEEMEHGTLYSEATGGATHVHDDSYEVAAKIALAHLYEVPDYYQALEELERKAEEDWGEGEEADKKRKEWVASNYKDEADILKKDGVEMPISE